MAEKIKVGGELEAVTKDGKLADAAQVVDSTQSKTQELINSEVKEKLDAASASIQTLTDGKVSVMDGAQGSKHQPVYYNSSNQIKPVTAIDTQYFGWNYSPHDGLTSVEYLIWKTAPNIFAFINPEKVTWEYTNDGGTTWAQKTGGDNIIATFNGEASGFSALGNKYRGEALQENMDAVRITIDSYGLYANTAMLIVYHFFSGRVKIEMQAATYANPDNYGTFLEYTNSGNPNYAVLPFHRFLFGNSDIKSFRLIFTYVGGGNATYAHYFSIKAFAQKTYSTRYAIEDTGLPYSLSTDKTATFFGGVSATSLSSSGTLTASTIKKSGGTSAQFLKADGSVDSTSYVSKIAGTAGVAYYCGSVFGWSGVKITTPFIYSPINAAGMIAFTIRCYIGYVYTDLVVSGYNYGSLHWHSPWAQVIAGQGKFKVMVGYNETAKTLTLWFGNASGVKLGYGGFSIMNVHCGHRNADMYSGWSATSCSYDAYKESDVAQVELTPLPPTNWGAITDTPTTLAGYNITDGYSSFTTSGSGNAVTDISASGHALTIMKGATFLTTHQDISGKVNKSDVESTITSTSTNPVTSKAISTALASKVDTVSGKGLSTNDYTTAEKTKLAGIAEGATKTTVDTALSTTSTNPVQNKVIAEALDNKADKGSQINLALTGTVDGYYAAASSIPSTVTAGTFACDQGSGTTKRCLTIVANGAIVNDVAAADGAIYLDKTNGHVYIAASGNKNAWVDGGQIKGDKGDKGADGKDGKDGVDGAQTVVQTTGTSTTDVMSQAATTVYAFLAAQPLLANCYLTPSYSFYRDQYEWQVPIDTDFFCRIKVMNKANTMCICGGYNFGTNRVCNYLWVTNGKLAYNPTSSVTGLTETDLYTFDDNYHDVYVQWRQDSDRTYIDGQLVMEHTNITGRSSLSAKIYILGYNQLDTRTYVPANGDVALQGPAVILYEHKVYAYYCGTSSTDTDTTAKMLLYNQPMRQNYNGAVIHDQINPGLVDCSGLIYCKEDASSLTSYINIKGTWKQINNA